MTDEELRQYYQNRLANTSCDEVPDFDSFFSEADLTVVPKRPIRLWPVYGAVASAAAVLALVFTLDRPVRQEEAPMAESQTPTAVQKLDSQAAEAVTEDTAELRWEDAQPAATIPSVNRVLTASAASADKALSPADDGSSVVDENAESPIVGEATAQSAVLSEDMVDATEDMPDEANEETSKTDSETLAAPRYERTIEEAYAQAAAVKSKVRRNQVQVGLNLNQDNSLLSAVTFTQAQSSISQLSRYNSINNHVASGVPHQSKNEWKALSKLPSGPGKYAPVYNLPVTGGISIGIPVGRNLHLQTGLNYTYLSASTLGQKEDNSEFTLRQTLHYLGVPLKLAYQIIDGQLGFYAAAGGGLEKGLAGKQHLEVENAVSHLMETENTTQKINGFQPYAGLQFGVTYNLLDQLQFYVEPGLSYYFDTDQPISSRTKSPLNFSVGGGFRILL